MVWERTGVSTYVLNDPGADPVVVQVIEDLTDVIFDSGLAAGDVLTFDGLNWVNQAPQDELVKVSEYDTMADYLGQKILGTSSRTTVTIVTDSAGVETLVVDVDESGIDHDALLNYVLNEHIDHSTVSVVAGGDDALAFVNNDLTSDIGLTVDIVGTTSTTDITSDSLLLVHDFTSDSLGVLRSITKADFLGDTGTTDELVKISMGDSAAGYLEDKLVAGDNVTLVTLTDSVGFETLEVNATDEHVKVSSDDAMSEYLEDKIVAGTDITVTTLTDSFGTETIEISFSGTASGDELVKVSSDDALAEYLEDKILGTTDHITVTTVTDSAGVETLVLDIGANVFDKSVDTTDDITEGVVNLFYTDERVDDRVADLLVGGTSITITYDDSAGSLTIDNDFPEQVRVSADDTVPAYLEDTIVAGSFIDVTTLTDSFGDETLEISFNGVATDELVKVSSDDALAEYLEDKILGTTDRITVTTVTDSGGVETLVIDAGTNLFDKTVDDTDDITEGVVNLFYTDERVDDRVADLLVGGTSITITYDDSAGSLTIDNDFPEQVRVSATDTVPSYLEDALVGGSFITLTTLTDSAGDETISIDFDGIVLEDVLDVTYDSAAPQTGDLLQYNGSEWNNTPPEDIPETQTWSFNGGHSQVGNNFTRGMSWGHQQAENGIVMLRDGYILGFSGSLTQPRASGTCEFQLTINGIAQNAAGETFLIDGTNTISNSLEFTTPLFVSAGDTVSAQTVTVGFSPTSSDPTVAFWGRDS